MEVRLSNLTAAKGESGSFARWTVLAPCAELVSGGLQLSPTRSGLRLVRVEWTR